MKNSLYTVSLVLKKQNSNGTLNIMNNVYTNIEALSKEDAFGICYDKARLKLPEHDLHLKIVSKQEDSALLTTALTLLTHIQQTLADTPNITEQPELMKLHGECVSFWGRLENERISQTNLQKALLNFDSILG